MILCGRNSVLATNIAIITRSVANVPVAADANPVAAFYRVDAISGVLALDLLVGTSGYITMAPVVGVTGMYSCPLTIDDLGHKQYHVVITYAVAASARAEIQEIMVLTELDVLSANAESLSGGIAFASRGAIIPP